jgi:DNA polymerase III alpha subunit (gram-positive type)
VNAKPRFVFLDMETTGLEAGVDQITEVAWITDDGKERCHLVNHTRLPGEWVLKNTDYLTRIATAHKEDLYQVLGWLQNDCEILRQQNAMNFGGDKGNVYLVGACPAFDDRFLRIAYGDRGVPYHYHVLDVEAMALGRFPLSEPCSLKDLRGLLGIPGENEAAHTALADAREVKLIFEAMRSAASGGAE